MLEFTMNNREIKILFDGTSTQSSTRAAFHGGGEYAKFMLRAAIEHGYRFDIVFSNRLFTDSQIEELVSGSDGIEVYHVDSKYEIYNLLEDGNYDTFYSALPTSYSDYQGSARLIGVVHGLRAAELPWDYYRYKYESQWKQRFVSWLISHCPYIQRCLKRKHISQSHQLLRVEGAKFVTASNHTKYAMLAFYPELKPENINVFYSPFSAKQSDFPEQDRDFYLMVSGNRYEKNVYRAMKVFDNLFSHGRLSGKKVVITGCGKEPFWNEIKNKNRFELKPYVSKEELDTLYGQAFCFVYPSLNEGFGYPPLQAMAGGTPVIASSATSIPEVCDDAACYFSPKNEDDLAARILRVEGDAAYRRTLINRGRRRVAELLELQNKQIEEELQLIFNPKK